MRGIKDLVDNVSEYKGTLVQNEFKSKKNTIAYVFIDNKPKVLKWFFPGFIKKMEKEYSVLNKASTKLNIPYVYDIDKKNNVLILNYINGENLCDIINDKNISFSEKKQLIFLLSEWFFEFHNFFKKGDEFIIRGDPNLRNFLFTDRIWGVDFEESRVGRPVEDIAGMCSSILTTDPMFTDEKRKLCKIFIESYVNKAPGRITNINKDISYAILERIQWRPEKEEELRKISSLIKEKGL